MLVQLRRATGVAQFSEAEQIVGEPWDDVASPRCSVGIVGMANCAVADDVRCLPVAGRIVVRGAAGLIFVSGAGGVK